MPNYTVLKVSAGQVPALGSAGSADVFRTTQTTPQLAADAAAAFWKLQPGMFMYLYDEVNNTRFVTSVVTAVG